MIEISEKEFLSGKKDPLIIAHIKAGKIIVFPSESSYGLAADYTNKKAIKQIREVKKEKSEKPIGLVTDSVKKAGKLVEVNEEEKELLEARLSGPLTVLFEEKTKTPCSGDGKLGVRIPLNKTLLRLCNLFSFPLTATSANITGESPIFFPEGVRKTFGKEDFVFISAGKLNRKKPSTYYDLTTGKVLREGKVTLKEIKNVLSEK